MNAVLLSVILAAGMARPAMFAERPPMFGSAPQTVAEALPKPQGCDCKDCDCSPCECDTLKPTVIGAMPVSISADGRFEAVANADYDFCRKLAEKEGRPLVVLIGSDYLPEREAAREPVVYFSPGDARWPICGLYRYEAQPGKAGLYRVKAPPQVEAEEKREQAKAAAPKVIQLPAATGSGCASGNCRRR